MNRALLIFPLIIFSLIAAVWTGWLRIGWTLPLTGAAGQHGAIMVNSFLASLIFLERAATFHDRRVLLVPAVHALSLVAFVFQFQLAAQLLIIAGSTGFTCICLYFIYRYKEHQYYLFLTGALCLLTGNLLLLISGSYPAAAGWWIGFLLFTIVGERLELTRYLPVSNNKKMILVLALATGLLALIWPDRSIGSFLLALSVAWVGLWLLRYDMARRAVKTGGQHRYASVLLIAGYVWLLVMACILLLPERFVFRYDAVLHSFFIGFVFSMIFSHAPVILPAVAKLPVRVYRPVLYFWAILLNLSLSIRIAGDLVADQSWRKTGGILNGFAILGFFVTIAIIVRKELTAGKLSLKKRPQ